jgi:hypothetical protein
LVKELKMKEIFTIKEALKVLGVSESVFNECTRTSIKGKKRTPPVKLQGGGRGKQRTITIVDLCVLEVVIETNKKLSIPINKLNYLAEHCYDSIEFHGLEHQGIFTMRPDCLVCLEIRFYVAVEYILNRVKKMRWKK